MSCHICCTPQPAVIECSECSQAACSGCVASWEKHRPNLADTSVSCSKCKAPYPQQQMDQAFSVKTSGKISVIVLGRIEAAIVLYRCDEMRWRIATEETIAAIRKQINECNSIDEVRQLMPRLGRMLEQWRQGDASFSERGACVQPNCKGCLVVTGPGVKSCFICNTQQCVACKELITGPHACDPATLETISVLKEFTKPCPGCKTPIVKATGCSMMFCVLCGCRFDWQTGEGINVDWFHNPEQPVSLLTDDPSGLLIRATSALLDALRGTEPGGFGTAASACRGLIQLHGAIKRMDAEAASSNSQVNPAALDEVCRQHCSSQGTMEQLLGTCTRLCMQRLGLLATFGSACQYYQRAQDAINHLLWNVIGLPEFQETLEQARAQHNAAVAAAAERYSRDGVLIGPDWQPVSRCGSGFGGRPLVNPHTPTIAVAPRVRQLLEAPVQNSLNGLNGSQRPTRRVAPTAIMPPSSQERLERQRAALAQLRAGH